jgi:hypothetical protein
MKEAVAGTCNIGLKKRCQGSSGKSLKNNTHAKKNTAMAKEKAT